MVAPASTDPRAALLAEAWVVLDRLSKSADLDLTGPERKSIEQLRQKVRANGIRLSGDNLDLSEFRKWDRNTRSAERRISG